MYKLVIQDDEGKTTVVPLIRDEITIGRKEGNTIRLTERNVSRRHARILRNDGTIQIEDLGSYNGVRVNGAKIAQRTALSVSDRAQIGDYLLEIKAEVTEAAPRANGTDASKTVPTARHGGVVGGAVDEALEHGLTTPMAVPPVPEGLDGAVPRAADDAPTLKAAAPVSAKASAPATEAKQAGRLVALSSNFAGQEWVLGGTQTVVGRTEDNDVVINHRSISRNHARLTRDAETGRYTISDLQSSNGVRVNGEEYGKVELGRGDVVDLGHVRLRFVEPGEDFVFGRDAQTSDVPVPSGSRPLIIGALAVLLVGGGLAAYMMMSRGSTKPEQVATGSGSGSGSAAVPVGLAPIDAAPAVAVADAAPSANAAAATKLASCREMIDKEEWANLQGCAKDVLELDATSADAETLAAQAKRELGNSLHFDRISDAVRQKDYGTIVGEYAKIDVDSVYRERARAAHDKARDAYQAQMVAQGKTLARKSRCDDLRKLASQSGNVWPEVGEAVGAISCTAQVVTQDPGPTNPPEACNYESLLSQAENASAQGSYGPALRYAEQAIKCNGAPKRPKQIAVLAACKLGNASKANTYYKQLGSSLPAGLMASCVDVITP
ncbi:MAG: FHA domain-containing protein [Kofleriaceae bacterium]